MKKIVEKLKRLDWRKVARSKTILVKPVIAALIIAKENTTLLRGILLETFYKTIAFGLPIINMLLRVIITSGLSYTNEMPREELDKRNQ